MLKQSFPFITLFCTLALSFHSYAGFKEVATSEKFEEPRAGYLKLLNSANGDTYLLIMQPKEKITIKKFDPQHKLVLNKELVTANEDILKGGISEVYEIKEHIIIFLSDLDGRVPTLYRVLINKNTLSIVKEDKVYEMPKVKVKVFIGGAPKDFDFSLPYFEVTKDDNSDNYAVCAFNTRAEKLSEMIHVSHFNEQHELISEAYCNMPDQPTLRIKNISLDVEEDKKITVLAIADRNMVFWGDLVAGQTAFHFEKLTFNGMVGPTDALVRLNPVTHEYIILSVKKIGKADEEKYLSYISRFNPVTKTVTAVPSNPVKVNEIARLKYKKKERFDGAPQDLILHEDGSYTIIYEEAGRREVNYQSTSNTGITRTKTYQKYFLKDIGITTYDKNGVELKAYYVPKCHQIDGLLLPFSYGRNKNAAVHLSGGIQYKQFFHFKSPKSEYVLFNDYEDNQEKIENHSGVKTVLSLNESIAYSFDLNQESSILKRKEVWPYQNNKKDGWLALFSEANYHAATNTLVTLKLDYRTKDMQLVWMQLEE